MNFRDNDIGEIYDESCHCLQPWVAKLLCKLHNFSKKFKRKQRSTSSRNVRAKKKNYPRPERRRSRAARPIATPWAATRRRAEAEFRQNAARFRLYRLRFLQLNMRFAAFFKIYLILKLKFLKFDKILQFLRHLRNVC